MLRSDLCDYSNAYIVVKGRITVEENYDAKTRNKRLIFKNNAPVRSCISKINNTFTENAEDRHIFISMYNLLQYSNNYFIKSGSLWNYYRDNTNGDENKNDNANNRINNDKTITSESFEYKKKIVGRTPDDNNTLGTEVVVPLEYLSNFWRFFQFVID